MKMDVSKWLTDVLTGAAFGSALTLSGVYRPSVIVAQMQLRNFHMVQTFLTASATSALLVEFASRTGHCPNEARQPTTFAHLPRYFGNIIGGLVIGSGMALTGACPGTVLVQGGLGIPPAIDIGLGGLLGGILFVKLAPALRHTSGGSTKTPPKNLDAAPEKQVKQPALTVASKLDIDTGTALLGFEAVWAVMIALAATIAPNGDAFLNPILGGLAIGAAQGLSIFLSRKTISVSSAYHQLSQDFWSLVQPSTHARSPSHSAVRFVAGIVAGAKTSVTLLPAAIPSGEIQQTGIVTAVVGGAFLIFGARLAGGCPSGHGISGTATLSLSSFVTVVAMFAGGVGWKALIG